MIRDYIDYVSMKRKELGGHAICPFAKAFLSKMEIIESTDFFIDAKNCLDSEHRPMLWLIYGDKEKFTKNWLENFLQSISRFGKLQRFMVDLGSPRSN